jgi:NADH-quinone oxidoreductase subunit C
MTQKYLTKIKALLEKKMKDHVRDAAIELGELEVWVSRASLIPMVEFLCQDEETLCAQLTDICGVDYPNRKERFEVVYHFLSFKHNFRVRLKLATDAETAVPTLINIYPAAGWWEREAHDMYGIKFDGNPDHRRLLTDYNFEGHPLRKDFPLSGYVEVRYDEGEKAVVYEPVKMTQEFRRFDFDSPWEGMERIFFNDRAGMDPADEKKG